MKNSILIIGALTVVSLSSCWWKAAGNDPGIEYAPDMYYSKGYEPMSQFSDSSKYRFNPYFMSMREPVEGTVAIGQLDYQYPNDNTPEGYDASASFSMNITLDEKDQLEGERLFGIYCSPCHGMKGGNDGPVSQKQAVLKPAWPNYQDQYIKDLAIGKIYHVLTYGKNNMGSYAYALTPAQRWNVANYVKRLSMMDADGNLPKIQVVNSSKTVTLVDTTNVNIEPLNNAK
ncbi:MAG: cytochrome c [Bacteroidia bacterium]|nr:cytochrome c [Bacteroidia bacterium]